jgi:hypothetical protein
MAITPGILPSDLATSPARTPLQIRTTSASSASSLKQVRRKDSFLHRADSSEDYPSPHESIFEAFYFSATNSDESNSRIELITLHPHVGLNDENKGPSTPPVANLIDDIQFRYGHGTVLETIAEQKSSGTRTVSRTKSLDGMPSFPFLNHRDSFVLSKSPRRKHSFSLDDLALINRYYHEACALIEKDACKACKPLPLEVPEIYAQPKKPLHAPPERPLTPPGMPSWTAAQNVLPRARVSSTPSRQTRFQRFFGLPPSGLTISSRMSSSPALEATRDRVASAPVRGRMAPRFRPPQSAYGPLDQHPFSRAPVALIAPRIPSAIPTHSPQPSMAEIRRQKSRRRRLTGQRVRFTASATARDSETIALQSAIESTAVTALHPLINFQAGSQSPTSVVPEFCCHHRNQPSKAQSNSTANHLRRPIPPSISYATLPSNSPTALERINARHFVSPVISRVTAGSSSPSLGDSVIFEDTTVLTTPEIDSQVSSVNSIAPLMSGALNRSMRSAPDLAQSGRAITKTSLKEKKHWCWKCKFEKVFESVDHWWIVSMSFVCFVCCGFDVDEDGSMVGSDTGAAFNPQYSGLRGGDGMAHRVVRGPRMVVLGHSVDVL